MNNIKLFKAKLRRWIYRSERIAKTSRECNKCCLTCRKYFVCLGTDATITDLWASADAGKISSGMAEQCAAQMEKVMEKMGDQPKCSSIH